MLNIVIVGGGRGGKALLERLHSSPNTKIIGLVDVRKSAPGISIAKRLGIPTSTDYHKFLNLPNIHFIIDVTGSKDFHRELEKNLPHGTELISGATARFMWEQIEHQVNRKDTIEQLLFQYQSIYDIGLKLTATQSLSRLLFHIVEDATKLTNTPAGSVALFDEGKGEMYLGAVKGFTDQFSKSLRWTLRKGGLTHVILNQKEPLVVKDVFEYPQFDNPVMLKEGIRSLMAAPLIAEGKIVGIVYVNDFKVRQFTPREASLLWLTSSIAATTIEKARSLEIAMQMAITDELTTLYNHRYFVQRFSQEMNRAARYQHNLSLALIDIDDFKHYNDSHGHIKGNEVLRQISLIMRKEFRDVDVIARFGGEEFAVIMPETTEQKAIAALNRFRLAVEEYPFEGRETFSGKRLTISAGLASFPKNTNQEDHSLIELADQSLYEAKGAGKNHVKVSRSRRRGTPRHKESSPKSPRQK